MGTLISTPTHEVSIVVDGVEITEPTSYQIKTSLTEAVDSFTIAFPFHRRTWDLCLEDRPVRVFIDGVPVITGRIDDRVAGDEYEVEITGRCNRGRLYDDCAESISYGGLTLTGLIQQLARPFFKSVVFTNVQDRALRRGKGKKARAGNEPALIAGRKKTGTQIEPGQTRWAVIEQLLEQTGLLAWSSGDGSTLIVSQPNYSQEVQFGFFRPAKDSRRASDGNVIGMRVKYSTGDRYSRVLVVGSGPGTAVNYGAAVAARYGEAKNNEATVDGEGLDFTAPKRLIVQRSIASLAEAGELADREMAKRDAHSVTVEVTAPGHGQRIARAFTTLFACDTLARVEDERTGFTRTCSIVSCTYQQSRGASATTTMDLVVKGAVIA